MGQVGFLIRSYHVISFQIFSRFSLFQDFSGRGLKALERAQPVLAPLPTLFHDTNPLYNDRDREDAASSKTMLKDSRVEQCGQDIGKIA